VEADGVGPREDRAGLDDRRADEGDGEDHAHRPDEAVHSDADTCGGGGGRLVGSIGRRRGLFSIRHERAVVPLYCVVQYLLVARNAECLHAWGGSVDLFSLPWWTDCSHFGQTSAITRREYVENDIYLC